MEPEFHFGWNCLNFDPENHYCYAAVEELKKKENIWLLKGKWYTEKQACALSGLSKAGLLTKIKIEGYKTRKKKPKIQLLIKNKWRTISEAKKLLKIGASEIIKIREKKQYNEREYHKSIEIFLPDFSAYGKCPLVETGGCCSNYESHGGDKIVAIIDLNKFTPYWNHKKPDIFIKID